MKMQTREYDTDAVPALGAIPGFSSGQLLVPPIVGRDQESSAMHECTHAFFDLQSIDIRAAEEEAICYVVGALYDRMTGLPRARWGTPPSIPGRLRGGWWITAPLPTR